MAAVSGTAFAQSTVTLFGGADLNYRSVTSGTNKFQGMAQDGIYSSRFGVMGTEDLGGGLKAGFHFEGGMNPDTGTPGGFNFARKSTVGVMGGFGEVRMGRDYTPLFTIAGIADPFGTNGVGSSYNLANSVTIASEAGDVLAAGGFGTAATSANVTAGAATASSTVYADPNAVRANNSVAYYSPNFSGFTAGLMYSFGGETVGVANRNAGKMTSLKLQYGAGPLVVAYGNQSTKGSTNHNAKWATSFLAGSYDLGVAKVSAGHKTDKLTLIDGTASDKVKSTILGVAAPVGAVTLKASYVTRKAEEKLGNQFALGAIYDLSKRTSLYAAYSALNNEAGYGMNVGSAAASDLTGLTSKGFEFGVKHNF